MKMTGRILFRMGVLFMSYVATATAQRMPQDNLFYIGRFGSPGVENGQFATWPKAENDLATGSNDTIFVSESGNHRIQVFDRDGNYLYAWGEQGSGNDQFQNPRGIAIGTNGLVYVADIGNGVIKVFSQTGEFQRSWACGSPTDVEYGRHDGLVYVTDEASGQVKVYSDGVTNELIRSWGGIGDIPGTFRSMFGIAVGYDGRVYVLGHQYIQMFDSTGGFISRYDTADSYDNIGGDVHVGSDGAVWGCSGCNIYGSLGRVWLWDSSLNLLGSDRICCGTTIEWPCAISESTSGRVVMMYHGYCKIYQRGFITAQDSMPSFPEVISVEQRPGTTYVDIDYMVHDANNTNVTVGIVAFTGGSNTLSNLLMISTLVEGTDINIGEVTANKAHRITWNAAADLVEDYCDISAAVLANDGRALLDANILNMPADGTNAALSISRDPITDEELIHCWYWMIATNDPSISLVTGVVYGASGVYSNQVLAMGSNTTAMGRAFIFQRLGYREATSSEVDRMRAGNTGITNQWTPRSSVGWLGNRPLAVNEWSFDTGNWESGANAYWVVKE